MLERLGHTGGAAVSTPALRRCRRAALPLLLPGVSLLPPKIVRRSRAAVRRHAGAPSPRTPRRARRAAHRLLVGGAPAAPGSPSRRLTGSRPRVRRPGSAFYGTTGRVAERVFPTLTEPLPDRAELRARSTTRPPGGCSSRSRIGVAIEDAFADDLVRGVVLTDALIGTFADAHDPSLRQNRCFLYHVIGGGTGDWDVPVGGMGALTDALAGAARAAGAEIVTGARGDRVETDGTPRRGHLPHGRRRAARSPPATCWSTPRRRRSPGCSARRRRTPAEGAQLKVNMLLRRLPRLRDRRVDPREAFAGTFHVAEGYGQLAHRLRGGGGRASCPPRRRRRSTATR